jgi:aspartyl-tRNA(Asn)/glutamyl-tRNA(Gln) amidotransferase subunit C
MELSKKEVEHIALLARLGLTEEEKDKFAKQISAILGYVEQLQEVNTEGIEPTAQVTGLINVMDQDEVIHTDSEIRRKLLDQAPETQDDLIKAKAVF